MDSKEEAKKRKADEKQARKDEKKREKAAKKDDKEARQAAERREKEATKSQKKREEKAKVAQEKREKKAEQAEKKREKKMKKAEEKREKQAKRAEKKREKDAKKADKKREKERDKAAKKSQKKRDKDAKKAEKKRDKAAKKAQKKKDKAAKNAQKKKDNQVKKAQEKKDKKEKKRQDKEEKKLRKEEDKHNKKRLSNIDQNISEEESDSSESETELEQFPVASLDDLKVLENADALLLQESTELPEVRFGFSTGVMFDVYLRNGTRLFLATEKNSCFKVFCFRGDRGFRFEIYNGDGKQILNILRNCNCQCVIGSQFWGDMCGHGVMVELPDGTELGEVTQLSRCCKPTYILEDEDGNKNFKLIGPDCGFCFCCRICCETEFKIVDIRRKAPALENEFNNNDDEYGEDKIMANTSLDKKKKNSMLEEKVWDPGIIVKKKLKKKDKKKGKKGERKNKIVGRISTNWTKLEHPVFGEGYTFGAEFPSNLDISTKATILGATILMEFLHFDKDPCGITQYCC